MFALTWKTAEFIKKGTTSGELQGDNLGLLLHMLWGNDKACTGIYQQSIWNGVWSSNWTFPGNRN